MSDSIISRSPRKPIGLWITLMVLGVLIGIGTWRLVSNMQPIASPAGIVGPPVRAATPDGDRVMLLTSQWRSFNAPSRGLNRRTYTDLLMDVWAFDAATGKPVWRRRISADRSGVNMGREILGAQDGVLWVLQPTGLLGLSTLDGAVVADTAKIEAANPALKGLLPTEAQYYVFDAGGLRLTAADGRKWRLAGAGLKAVADSPAPTTPAPGVFLHARVAGGNGTWAFMARGLHTRGLWLGLMDEEEAKTYGSQNVMGGIDPTTHPRTRLWFSKLGTKQTFFGEQLVYQGFKPYPDSPEFLQGGLLTDNRINALPIMLFKPDSVLVLDRDRLGDKGRLRLTRISGPRGKVIWTADLPMQGVEAVMPGETSIVLTGRRDEETGARKPGDRLVSVDQLVAIDYATGKMGAYGFLVKSTKPEDIPVSSTVLPETKP